MPPLPPGFAGGNVHHMDSKWKVAPCKGASSLSSGPSSLLAITDVLFHRRMSIRRVLTSSAYLPRAIVGRHFSMIYRSPRMRDRGERPLGEVTA